MEQYCLSKVFIQNTIWIVINFFSFSFVIWKSSECVIKYLDKPKGTTLSIETTDNHLFPAITVCALERANEYNGRHLKKCGINGYINN